MGKKFHLHFFFVTSFIFSNCLNTEIWTVQDPYKNPLNWLLYYSFMEPAEDPSPRKTWTLVFQGDNDSFSKRYGQFGFSFSDHILLIGGINTSFGLGFGAKDTWVNADSSGIHWTQMEMNPANELDFIANGCPLKYQNKFWILGGVESGSSPSRRVYNTDSNLIPSTFAKWNLFTQSTAFSPRYGHSCACMSNKMWVIGGGILGNPADFTPNVASSTDGATWTAEAALPYEIGFHCTVFFDSTLWVIGGRRNNKSTNSILKYDTMGTSWKTITPKNIFPARFGHSCLVFNNKIWVIGGAFDETATYDDVWFSEDGANWIQDEHFIPARVVHFSYIHNNKMWLVSGRSSIGGGAQEFNDVWSYSPSGSGQNTSGSSLSDETMMCN